MPAARQQHPRTKQVGKINVVEQPTGGIMISSTSDFTIVAEAAVK
jgi:hypothetical protein